jgi:alpha-L-rhamnosidase
MPQANPAHPPLADAVWIGTPLRGSASQAPPSPMLRRRFDLPVKPTAGRLHITALGLYEPHLNGRRIGDLELRPGWTDYRRRLQVQTYDVTDQLREGTNVLGVWLGDGWYSGKVAHLQRGAVYRDAPRLLAALTITDAAGHDHRVCTDACWRWNPGPIVSADLMDGEHFDARQRVDDWLEPDSDDAGWSPVELAPPDPWPEQVVSSEAPPVRITQELRPVDEPRGLTTGGDRRRFLFDFGQNFAGKTRLTVRGQRGLTVRLQFAEVLSPDGTQLDRSNLRTCIATDNYTLRGDPEPETWTPRFTFHGFRYAELSYEAPSPDPNVGEPLDPPDRSTLVGLVMHSDMRRTGHFETGHQLLNRLHENIVWGLRSNFLEVPTDCPQRDERLGWTGDAQVFAATASFLYDTTDFFGKWIDDLIDAQGPGGEVPSMAPQLPGDTTDAGAGWSDAAVVVPWEVFRASGRRGVLERAYPMMQRWAAFQARTAEDGVRGGDDAGIFAGYGDWLALDADSNDPRQNATPKDLIGTAYHARSQRLFARIARLLGHPDHARTADAAANAAVAAFRRRFVRDGRVTIQSQTSHLLALAFDLLPEADRPGVFDDLLHLLAQREHHLSTGFLGTPLWCDTLCRFGRTDLAYDLILNPTYPGWLYPVTLGATTMWERWNSWHPDHGFVETKMNSLNHYAYGAVGDWLHRTAAGIDLDMTTPTPTLTLRPKPDRRLGHCHGSLDSPIGPIDSRWTIDGDVVRYTVQVPDDAVASLHLIGEPPAIVQAGTHRLQRPLTSLKPHAAADAPMTRQAGPGSGQSGSPAMNPAAR